MKPKRVMVEGLAIVVSILLAFGIDAWWDRRNERRLETEYLAALTTEVRDGLTEIRGDLRQRERLETRLAYVLSGDDIPADSLRATLRDAAIVSNVAPPTAVVDDLVSSGRLSLIRSSEIREAVMLYRQMLAKNEANEAPHHEFVDARFIPYLAERLPLAGIVGRLPDGARGTRATDRDLARLHGDVRFDNMLLERLYRLQRGLGRLRSTRDHLEHMLELLEN